MERFWLLYVLVQINYYSFVGRCTITNKKRELFTKESSHAELFNWTFVFVELAIAATSGSDYHSSSKCVCVTFKNEIHGWHSESRHL